MNMHDKNRPDTHDTNVNFPVVGIGASAGGLEAITALLKELPANTGMAFVFVQHLAPTRESMLTELLSRETSMPVLEIKDGMDIQPNHFYVIPPNTYLGMLHGTLHLMPRGEAKEPHLPIDFFMRSLAKEQSSRAIGVILSGSASDGVHGLMEIKAEGGITFAQNETTAAHASMPHSAIAAGCVDFILPPQSIAHELARIGQHPFLKHELAQTDKATAGEEDNLRKIFLLIRQTTGNDFTYYKQSTIMRRIKRRILLHKLERMEDYVRYLQSTPSEVEALFRDLLINVTNFFRDPEVFESLKENAFPTIMKNRPDGLPVRIWVAGCSTGEEVYSIAIALFEYLGDMASNTPIQFFATDLDEQAIEKARSGIYPKTIEEHVSSKRLQRFFIKVDEGYQISKSIRDVCIFAQQNVFKDPPFSRLDLISCRNLLIYLTPVLQKKIMPIFNYALNNNGFLLLGSSETIGRHADLFRLADKKIKLYEKKSISGPIHFNLAEYTGTGMTIRKNDQNQMTQATNWSSLDIQREADRIVLKKFAPAGVVINEELDVLQFRGHTGEFLEPASGEASLNLIKMARNGLQIELRNAIHKAITKNTSVRKENIHMQYNDHIKNVCIEVTPLLGPENQGRCFLVLFQQIMPSDDDKEKKKGAKKAVSDSGSEELKHLQQEIIATQEYMHTVIEQQEVANEELTSANEEIQASNEELQSTNEELETAKEELQSSNEELATVNDELASRNDELEQLSNDLTNLITGLSIPVVMVNDDLRIRRFSQAAENLLNLIPTDLGRPITHLKANIVIPDIEKILLRVIDAIKDEKIELQDTNGYWYRVHFRPYKTHDNKISGALIAFIDINEIKLSLNAAEKSRHYAEAIVSAISYPMLVLDKDLQVYSASDVFYKKFKVNEKETVGNLLYRLGNGQWGIPQLRKKLEDTIAVKNGFDNFIVEHTFEHIGNKKMKVSGRYIAEGINMQPMILMQIEDIT